MRNKPLEESIEKLEESVVDIEADIKMLRTRVRDLSETPVTKNNTGSKYLTSRSPSSDAKITVCNFFLVLRTCIVLTDGIL